MTNTNPIEFYKQKGDNKNIIVNTRKANYQDLCDAVYEKLIIPFENEWRERFAGYAKKINNNQAEYEKYRKKYAELLKGTSLEIYTSVGSTIKSSPIFNVRFQGESIGNFTKSGNDIVFKFVSTHRKKNKDKRYNAAQFKKDGKTVLDEYGVKDTVNNKEFEIKVPSEKFNKLKEFFSEKNSGKIEREYDKSVNESQNKEHEFESAILTALEDDLVLLNNTRFQMHTPLGASFVITKNFVKYSGKYGKGPDILTKKGNTLNVIELKDEPSESKSGAAETPKNAIKQAICYAVFLNVLLNYRDNDDNYNSECVKPWREILGFDTEGTLETNAVICMPYSSDNNIDLEPPVLNLRNGSTISLEKILFDKNKVNDTKYMKQRFSK